MNDPKAPASAAPAEVRYNPSIFNATTAQAAREIILTPERGTTTDERWQKETPFLIDQIAHWIGPTPQATVLDYGCGIGRLSKGVIQRFGATVVGVDLAPNMRLLAAQYVAHDRFIPASLAGLEGMVHNGLSCDVAIACWVLQHCLEPVADVRRIKAAMKPGGLLFVVNNTHRAVPTTQGWMNDDIDIRGLLQTEFVTVGEAPMPELVTVPDLVKNTFIGLYRKT